MLITNQSALKKATFNIILAEWIRSCFSIIWSFKRKSVFLEAVSLWIVKFIRIYYLSLFAVLLFASPALAAWQHLGTNEKADFYIYLGKVKKSNGFAYAWFLREHSKLVAGLKSFVMLAKVNCSNATFKQIWHLGFHGQRATGNYIRLPELRWIKPKRSGINEKVIKNACFEII